MAQKAASQNGLVLLSPAAASRILVQSFRATTGCEFDLARKRPGRAIGLRPWIPKQLLEYFSCVAEALPLDPAERKSKGENSTTKSFSRPWSSSLPPCS